MVSQMIASELRKRHPALNISIDENHKALLVEGKVVYLNDIANEGVLESFHMVATALQEEVLDKISARIISKIDFMDAKLNQEAPVASATVVEPKVEIESVVQEEVAVPEADFEEANEEPQNDVAPEGLVPEVPAEEPKEEAAPEAEKPAPKKAKKS